MKLSIIGPDDPALDVLQDALSQQSELSAELTIIPWPSYRHELMATLRADTAPNQAVFIPGHIWLPGLVAAGFLAETAPLLDSTPETVLRTYNPDDILPSAAAESNYQGKSYLLPFFSDGHILFYRSDLIQLDESQGIPVVSTRELADLAAGVHNPPGVYGLALKADVSEIFTDWLPYLWEAGGMIFDEQGCPAIDTATNITALERYCSLRKFCPPDTHTYGNTEIADSLRRGEAALVANWGGQTAPIALDEANEWRTIYKTAVFPTPWNVTWGIGIPKNQPGSTQREVVTMLLQLLEPKLDREITRIAGSPVRQSSYEASELQRYTWLPAQAEMLRRAKPLPARPELDLFLDNLQEAVYRAFIGQTTPTKALHHVQEIAVRRIQ